MNYKIVFNNELRALLKRFSFHGAQCQVLVEENLECPLSFSLSFVIIIIISRLFSTKIMWQDSEELRFRQSRIDKPATILGIGTEIFGMLSSSWYGLLTP